MRAAVHEFETICTSGITRKIARENYTSRIFEVFGYYLIILRSRGDEWGRACICERTILSYNFIWLDLFHAALKLFKYFSESYIVHNQVFKILCHDVKALSIGHTEKNILL